MKAKPKSVYPFCTSGCYFSDIFVWNYIQLCFQVCSASLKRIDKCCPLRAPWPYAIRIKPTYRFEIMLKFVQPALCQMYYGALHCSCPLLCIWGVTSAAVIAYFMRVAWGILTLMLKSVLHTPVYSVIKCICNVYCALGREKQKEQLTSAMLQTAGPPLFPKIPPKKSAFKTL